MNRVKKMKLSPKAQYAIQAMLKLSLNFDSKAVTLSEISSTQSISISYLEQLFSTLRKFELVQGVRGPGGGYCLNKSPSKISIADIVLAVEKTSILSISKIQSSNKKNRNSISNQLWDDFSEQLRVYLDSITLADLIKEHVVVKNQYRLNENTKRISTMFPVSENLRAA